MGQERYTSDGANAEGEVQPVYGPAITPSVINELRGIHEEIGWQEGDWDEVRIRVPDANFHRAAAIAVLFDEISRFQDKGFFVSGRALRVLRDECGIPVEILGATPEPKQVKMDVTEEAVISERPSIPVIPFPKSGQVYNERAHAKVRTASDLL